MTSLVIIEHNNQNLELISRNVIGAAKQLDNNIILLVVGYQCQRIAELSAQIAGVTEVWLVNHQLYQNLLAENLSELISSLVQIFNQNFQYITKEDIFINSIATQPINKILISASTVGKNLLPRIAAQLDCIQVSNVVKIINESTFEHPIYAGNIIETVEIIDPIKLLTIRAIAFTPEYETQIAVKILDLSSAIQQQQILYDSLLNSKIINQVKFIKHELAVSERPELTNAKIVVSGGRGLQSGANFKLIDELALELGAAVGATRAAVDAGFISNDYQVGQTGKTVAPELYVAIGISGAVQHLSGMKDSKIIVAINKDPDAPIFKIADYGLVGDLFEIVPQFIAALKSRKN